MKPYLLQNEELKELSVKIRGWEIMKNHIEREFNFSNFIEAFSFMTKIALICEKYNHCLLYTSPSPRDRQKSRMPSSA